MGKIKKFLLINRLAFVFYFPESNRTDWFGVSKRGQGEAVAVFASCLEQHFTLSEIQKVRKYLNLII